MFEALDPTDLRLLDEFQRALPLVPRPFAAIAATLGVGESHVIARLAAMQAAGRVARVGATVRPNTAGASTLAALAVPEGRMDRVAAIVGDEPGVNHSYEREGDHNLWFVATAPDGAGLDALLARIGARSGLPVLDLRLVRAFNIDLGFRLSDAPSAMAPDRPADVGILRAGDRILLQALSEGLALVPEPYGALAARLGCAEPALRHRIGELLAAGIITRLGVIVRHRALGWTSNAMVVWDVPAADVAATGRALAQVPGVTLCYERRPVPGVWPYRLFCMIHARSRDGALAVLARAAALPDLSGVAHRVLFSTRCFKQQGARIAEVA
jgi:DNA-binding Lrp family transcriptional regulator